MYNCIMPNMIDDKVYVLSINAFTILEQVKRTPGIRKRKLYSSPQMLRIVNNLLDDEYLRILHPTYNASSVSITDKGQRALDGLWAAAKGTGEIDLYKKEIERRIEHNLGSAKSRDEGARNVKKKTHRYDPGEYILKGDEYIPRDEYYASVEKEE